MIQHVRFAELPVENQDRAIRFYTEKLGFSVAQDAAYRDDWRWVELAIPGAQTRLLLTRKTDDETEPSVPRLALTVDDVAATHAELEAKGVTFTKGPTQAPWDRGEAFALFQDSEANTVIIGTAGAGAQG